MTPPVPLRILLVDDNALNRRIALGLLKTLGEHADVATTGVEAVESVAARVYDLVLMDVEMPSMDGLEATRVIRSQSGPTPRVVAMTAGAEGRDRQACLAAGMDDYLTKPLDRESLATVVDRARAADHSAVAARSTGPVRGTDSGRAPSSSDGEPAPLFDPTVAARLAEAMGERGPTVVAQLVDMFLNDAPAKVAILHVGGCATGPELGEVRRAAHSLRSSAASLGALRLSAASRNLEAAALSGDTASLPDLVAAVVAELASARPALESLGAKPAPGVDT